MKSIKYILSLLICGSISAGATEYVEPGGGYLIEAAAPTVIKWDNSKLASPVKIELWNLEEQAFSTIADSVADSSYTYSFSNLIAEDLLRVKITSLVDTMNFQMSDSFFSVYIPEPILQKRHYGADESTEGVFTVFPNPVISDFTIESSVGIAKLEIYSAIGELVFTADYNGIKELASPFRFNTQGMYCIKVIDTDGELSSKTIVVK